MVNDDYEAMSLSKHLIICRSLLSVAPLWACTVSRRRCTRLRAQIEYVGIPRNHPHSNHTFMFSNFFR
ncbi:hypothetical protein niasHS_007123 [Heterodera schachtii]|uniref:Secreted protein n=1 Tax=Heterodera schachtii TaxID=97005 RepID=A0ABD2JL98_HETSC